MRLLLTILTLSVSISVLFAQKKEEITFADAYQIDSSKYFLIPKLLDDSNKDHYEKGKGNVLWAITPM